MDNMELTSDYESDSLKPPQSDPFLNFNLFAGTRQEQQPFQWPGVQTQPTFFSTSPSIFELVSQPSQSPTYIVVIPVPWSFWEAEAARRHYPPGHIDQPQEQKKLPLTPAPFIRSPLNQASFRAPNTPPPNPFPGFSFPTGRLSRVSAEPQRTTSQDDTWTARINMEQRAHTRHPVHKLDPLPHYYFDSSDSDSDSWETDSNFTSASSYQPAFAPPPSRFTRMQPPEPEQASMPLPAPIYYLLKGMLTVYCTFAPIAEPEPESEPIPLPAVISCLLQVMLVVHAIVARVFAYLW